jgi:alpha-1,2-mannosyltransferase
VDFHVYYASANMLRRGEDMYTQVPYIYPPLLAVLVQPLATLPANTSTMLWKVSQHLALLASWGLLVSLVPKHVRLILATLLLFGLATTIVREEVRLGQINSIILLLIVAGLYLVARSSTRQSVGGALVGLAASIKVLPITLVAYLLTRGPRRAAIGAGSAVVLLFLAQLAVVPAALNSWVAHFPAIFQLTHGNIDNQSINAALSRALLPSVHEELPVYQLADQAAIRPYLVWSGNVLVVAITALVLLRQRRPTTRLPLLLAVSLLATHMASGSTWLAHLLDLAVVQAALLWAWAERRDGWPRGRVAALAVLAGLMALLIVHPGDWVRLAASAVPAVPLIAWVASNVPLWVVLGLWVLTIRAILRADERTPAPAMR